MLGGGLNVFSPQNTLYSSLFSCICFNQTTRFYWDKLDSIRKRNFYKGLIGHVCQACGNVVNFLLVVWFCWKFCSMTIPWNCVEYIKNTPIFPHQLWLKPLRTLPVNISVCVGVLALLHIEYQNPFSWQSGSNFAGVPIPQKTVWGPRRV